MLLTRVHQRNAVSQGLALGLLIRGYPELPADKVTVDLAFTGAWLGWTHRHLFPQVNTDLTRGRDGLYVVTRADDAKHVAGVHWARDGYRWVVATPDPDWGVEDSGDIEFALNQIGTDVPLDAWTALADDFLARAHR